MEKTMTIRAFLVFTTAIAVVPWINAPSAHALTMKECSAKYETAKSAGTLKGMNWNEFRKAQCGPDAAANAAPVVKSPSGAPLSQYRPPADTAAASATFPSAISPKYKDQTAGRARMRTCLDQYEVNKTANANGGLKWIQKGGGYYSQCNRRLSQMTQ
jgi:hypothetical protein